MAYTYNPNIYSTERKLSLSGWLQEHNNAAYCSPLRLQKFLFFYESFSKVANDTTDFSHLRGYKRGPVFSNVWGDYTKERHYFDNQSLQAYQKKRKSINDSRAAKASFIVNSLSESELSSLTHQFHIWSAKEERIMDGEAQVALDEKDFNLADYKLTKTLEDMYPDDLVENSVIIPIGEKSFVFSKEQTNLLTEQHFDILSTLSEKADLHNPVFVEIDEEGRLCVD